MVGEGRRFAEAGYKDPKPLIEVCGKPIVQWAIESLKLDGIYTFVVRDYGSKELNERLETCLKGLVPDCNIIRLDRLTRGAAESVLMAEEHIGLREPLLVANCDQYTPWQANEKARLMDMMCDYDGIVTTFNHIPPETISDADIRDGTRFPYSFAHINPQTKMVDRLSEKIAISRNMLNGIHYWRQGIDFISSAEAMIESNITYNNEFYVSLTYNELVDYRQIQIFPMSDKSYYSLGTPEDVKKFEQLRPFDL